MSAFDDVFDIIAEVKAAGKVADRLLAEVGDDMLADIPDAKKVNALLVRGTGGKRYRIDGLHVTREK